MYAADEVYDTAELEDPLTLEDLVIPCEFPTEADVSGEHVEIIRCGAPSVDDAEERCAEHMGEDAYPW